MNTKFLTFTALCCLSYPLAYAQSTELNIYSARHYPTDEALYSGFTQKTGIKINRVDADDAGIIARLKAEGSEGLFQPIQSKALTEAIPEQFRAKAEPNGITWFGFSTRARVIVYNKASVKAQDVNTYESLAAPSNKGRFCVRSGSHPYNLFLFGAVMEHLGEKQTQQWLAGLVQNMARSPKGGDTDQIKAVASGECGVALTNTYYMARLLRSDKAEDKAVVEKVGVVFPNQSSWGTHVNIAGGAVAKNAPHQANAIKFLEYLASPTAQSHFADGNNEWPAAKGIQIANPALQAMSGGNFKSETVPISVVGMNQVKVQQLLDRVGFK